MARGAKLYLLTQRDYSK